MTAGSLHNSDHLAKKPGLSTLNWSSVAWISLIRVISVQVFVTVIFGCWHPKMPAYYYDTYTHTYVFKYHLMQYFIYVI